MRRDDVRHEAECIVVNYFADAEADGLAETNRIHQPAKQRSVRDQTADRADACGVTIRIMPAFKLDRPRGLLVFPIVRARDAVASLVNAAEIITEDARLRPEGVGGCGVQFAEHHSDRVLFDEPHIGIEKKVVSAIRLRANKIAQRHAVLLGRDVMSEAGRSKRNPAFAEITLELRAMWIAGRIIQHRHGELEIG